MKYIESSDPRFLQAIIDRIDGELSYPNDFVVTYSYVFTQYRDSYIILIEDDDVATLLTVEEQALVNDLPDDIELNIFSQQAIAVGPFTYSTCLFDGEFLIGEDAENAIVAGGVLYCEGITTDQDYLGGDDFVFTTGEFYQAPPLSNNVIGYGSDVIAFVLETDQDGIPKTYLGF